MIGGGLLFNPLYPLTWKLHSSWCMPSHPSFYEFIIFPPWVIHSHIRIPRNHPHSLGQYPFQSVVVELDGGSALNNRGKRCCPWRPKLGTTQMSIYRGCIKKLWYINRMESASAIQRIKQLLYATTSMTLRGIILTERRQTQKSTSRMISFTCKFRESKATL